MSTLKCIFWVNLTAAFITGVQGSLYPLNCQRNNNNHNNRYFLCIVMNDLFLICNFLWPLCYLFKIWYMHWPLAFIYATMVCGIYSKGMNLQFSAGGLWYLKCFPILERLELNLTVFLDFKYLCSQLNPEQSLEFLM